MSIKKGEKGLFFNFGGSKPPARLNRPAKQTCRLLSPLPAPFKSRLWLFQPLAGAVICGGGELVPWHNYFAGSRFPLLMLDEMRRM